MLTQQFGGDRLFKGQHITSRHTARRSDHLRQAIEPLLTQHALNLGLTDPGSCCAVPFEDTHLDQMINGAPDRHTADPELFCQFTFRGDPVSRHDLCTPQHGLYSLLHLDMARQRIREHSCHSLNSITLKGREY
ncbi:hypothetical protein GCM10022631_25770 [Deinococcus rubellus]